MSNAVLIIRLSGPLQSWGSDSKYNTRKTNDAPTKSGVLGMIAAALGRKRGDSLDDLKALRFGVRIDSRGKLLRDFQIVYVPRNKENTIANKYYLQDAVFTVCLEGERKLLETIDEALKKPVFPLFLGRKCCPPNYPITRGLKDYKSIEDAFENEPLALSEYMRIHVMYQKKKLDPKGMKVKYYIDAETAAEADFVQMDTPASFDPSNRMYSARPVSVGYIDWDRLVPKEEGQ